MTLRVSISQEAEAALRQKAAAAGQDVAAYAAGVLERTGRQPLAIEAISGPLAGEFGRSGMTDEQLSELLEHEKHAMRAERRPGVS